MVKGGKEGRRGGEFSRGRGKGRKRNRDGGEGRMRDREVRGGIKEKGWRVERKRKVAWDRVEWEVEMTNQTHHTQ